MVQCADLWYIIKSFIGSGYQRVAIEKRKVMVQKWGFSDDDLNSQTLTGIIENLKSFSEEV